jgi:hypothetical protein
MQAQACAYPIHSISTIVNHTENSSCSMRAFSAATVLRDSFASFAVAISEKGKQLRDYAAYLVEVMPRWIQEARVTQMDELEVCRPVSSAGFCDESTACVQEVLSIGDALLFRPTCLAWTHALSLP